MEKITERCVAFKFCVAEGMFSQETIKSLREAEFILKDIAKVYCVIVNAKTADFLVGES